MVFNRYLLNDVTANVDFYFGLHQTHDSDNIAVAALGVSNNLNFFVIADLGAFSYQMLNQLKIVCSNRV